MKSILVGLALLSLLILPQTARGLNPGNDTNDGADPFPEAVWIDVDIHGGIVSTRDCSGTLIAADLVVTAAHCFDTKTIANVNATIGFGNGNTGKVNSASVTAHPNWLIAGTVTDPNPAGAAPSDIALIRLASNVTTVNPAPLMISQPSIGDIVKFAGYGDSHTPPKRWTGAPGPVNPWALESNFLTVEYAIAPSINRTEPGDSGGPQFKTVGGSNFVLSDLQGVPPPSPPSAQSETHIRIDRQSDASGGGSGTTNIQFLNSQMPNPTAVTITHNIPADPSTLAPNDLVGILIKATYPAARSAFVFAPFLYEDDSLILSDFDGDIRLGPSTGTLDDLAGYGYLNSVFSAPAIRTVYAWDFVAAFNLLPFDEAGNPLDPDLDWLLDIELGTAANTQFDLTSNAAANVSLVSLASLKAAVISAESEIDAGTPTALQAMFKLVPEPGTAGMVALGILLLSLGRRRRLA